MALRDIKVGEELLFNYGKKFADKHGLNKKLPKAKDGSKRGVVVGEEALEGLDGLNPASRETRGKMTAIRGGHGGARNKKARKEAPENEPEPVTEEAAQEDDMFAQNDEDEEDVRDGRKKRQIVRSARYTR
jgi:histone-lysine N-methyltransferase EZH2